MAFGTGRLRLAVQEGDVLRGSMMAGQIAGLVHDVLPAAKVVHGVVAQAERVLAALPSHIVGS